MEKEVQAIFSFCHSICSLFVRHERELYFGVSGYYYLISMIVTVGNHMI